jgi:hypothetical protein
MGVVPDPARLGAVLAGAPAAPTYAIPALAWEALTST